MCTSTSTKQQRTKDSVIRTDGKADVKRCIRLWIAYRRRNVNLSCREFARLIGEAPSTVRYIFKKGTSAKRLAEKPHDYFISSRSTIYRLLRKGELRDKDNNPLPYKRYKRPHPKPAPTDHSRNHAPKHMINELSSAARNHL